MYLLDSLNRPELVKKYVLNSNYTPDRFTPKLKEAFSGLCKEQNWDETANENKKIFWKYFINCQPVWSIIPVIGAPSEIAGLPLQDAVKFMIKNFPYPLIEFICSDLVVINYLFTSEVYNQRNIEYTFVSARPVIGKRIKYLCFIFIIPGLQLLLENYQAFQQFFKWLKENACFYIAEHSGNIVVCALFTSPMHVL